VAPAHLAEREADVGKTGLPSMVGSHPYLAGAGVAAAALVATAYANHRLARRAERDNRQWENSSMWTPFACTTSSKGGASRWSCCTATAA
jgi:hypothetical protein